MDDAQILAACPDYISIGEMFKAFPRQEDGKRYVYFEASNEARDQQGEVIAAKALSDSADFYLKFGNVDIDHYTKLGPRLGIPNHLSYEIGRPIDVRQDGKSTFVKAEIYQGDGPAAEKANEFWSSIHDIQPPHRWYPSVAGAVMEKAITFDPDQKAKRAIIKRVRWENVGLSKTPVNDHVSVCATMPVGAFAKCWVPGIGLDIAKAMEAGYGTDSATLTGGGALRRQSLYGAPINYFDFRNRISRVVTAKSVAHDDARGLVDYAVKNFGCSHDEAAEYVERFAQDLSASKRRLH